MTGKVALLLADVDGTLVTQEKLLTDGAKAAVKELRGAGVKFAVTSGRPPRGMAMLIEPLGIDTPIAGFNGGVFVNPDLSVVESRTLDPKTARTAVALLDQEGLDAWVYTPEEWLVRNKDAPHVDREAWTVKFAPRVVAAFGDAEYDKVTKVVGVSDDHAKVASCEKAMQTALGRSASAARSQPYYLDVTHPDANKGAVVHALSKLLGIPVKAIATIGDMPNDVLMFREGGLSIAMGNASEDVQKQADEVTASNEEDGFAKAVRRFVLGQR